jgi:hypothetical protein
MLVVFSLFWRDVMLLDNIIGWIKKLTEAGVAAVAVAEVVHEIF